MLYRDAFVFNLLFNWFEKFYISLNPGHLYLSDTFVKYEQGKDFYEVLLRIVYAFTFRYKTINVKRNMIVVVSISLKYINNLGVKYKRKRDIEIKSSYYILIGYF